MTATILLLSGVVAAQQSALIIDGPAPPTPPDVITRDAAGRATVRAIKLDERLGHELMNPALFPAHSNRCIVNHVRGTTNS
jgi:hypothetical protein